jgi:hypothetical protein
MPKTPITILFVVAESYEFGLSLLQGMHFVKYLLQSETLAANVPNNPKLQNGVVSKDT